MPELIECTIISEELDIKLSGKIINSYYKGDRAKASGFEKLVCPVEIKKVRSHGKKVIIELSSNHLIIGSLGMTGKFIYQEGKHSHIRFDIEDDTPFSVYFDDTRYFGKIDIIESSSEPKYFANIGPCLKCALNDETWFTSEEWTKIFKPKLLRRKMCDIMIDQSIIAGIGQYLMVEILYYAGIHPKRIGNTITKEELELIRINSQKVIKLSYDHNGFTLRDFLSPSKKPGVYPAAVYGKFKDPNGYKVVKEKLTNGRSIHFVAELQEL